MKIDAFDLLIFCLDKFVSKFNAFDFTHSCFMLREICMSSEQEFITPLDFLITNTTPEDGKVGYWVISFVHFYCAREETKGSFKRGKFGAEAKNTSINYYTINLCKSLPPFIVEVFHFPQQPFAPFNLLKTLLLSDFPLKAPSQCS